MVIFHSYVKLPVGVCISWRILYAKLHWFPDMFACFVHTVVLSPSVLFSTWFRFVLLFNVVLYSFVCIVLWCVLSCHVISEHVWYVMKWLYGLACLACLHFSLSGLFAWDNHSPTRMVSGQLQKRYCRTYWGLADPESNDHKILWLKIYHFNNSKVQLAQILQMAINKEIHYIILYIHIYNLFLSFLNFSPGSIVDWKKFH